MRTERTEKLAASALAVVAALGVAFAGAWWVKQDVGLVLKAFGAMFSGALGDWAAAVSTGDFQRVLRPLGESLTRASVLCFAGLSVAAALRVGLFNIGAHGQFVVGAFAAAAVGASAGLPDSLQLLAALLAAALAGAAWAAIPATLKLRRGVHEVISTIMMNWIAVSLVDNWLVTGPFKATAAGDNSISGTAQILPGAALPHLLGDANRLNLGFILAVFAALALSFFLSLTVRGFEWRATGLGAEAARASGISVERSVWEAMLSAGALAGLGGAVLILGTELKYPAVLASPYGFDGIAMALIGQGNPLGVLASSALFGAMRAGGTHMQLFGIHKSFPELIQGLTLLFVAARPTLKFLSRRRARAAVS